MQELRCPVDGKLLFKYDEQGRIHIKCKGHGHREHYLVIASIDGRPVVVSEEHPTT